MNNLAFIADFFVEQINGGGEQNNEEIIKLLQEKNYKVTKILSYQLSYKDILNNDFFIVGNFTGISEKFKTILQKTNYIIYDHDYKFVENRNPAIYKDYKIPENKIINKEFYANAKAILCQSSLQKRIFKKNLELDNIINLSGNAWSDEAFEHIKLLNEKFPISKKRPFYSIVNSQTSHKNTNGAIEYCKKNQIPFFIIPPTNHKTFLAFLSKNKKLVFLPQTPETLSRVALEAKMLNVEVITNENLGASYEDWYHLNGNELISLLSQKKHDIVKVIENLINENMFKMQN
jgi:hypothetical protein